MKPISRRAIEFSLMMSINFLMREGYKKELKIGFVGKEPAKTIRYDCSCLYLKIVTLQKQLKTIDVNYPYTGPRDGILIPSRYHAITGWYRGLHFIQIMTHKPTFIQITNHVYFFPDHFTNHVIASLLQSFCLRLLAPPFG